MLSHWLIKLSVNGLIIQISWNCLSLSTCSFYFTGTKLQSHKKDRSELHSVPCYVYKIMAHWTESKICACDSLAICCLCWFRAKLKKDSPYTTHAHLLQHQVQALHSHEDSYLWQVCFCWFILLSTFQLSSFCWHHLNGKELQYPTPVQEIWRWLLPNEFIIKTLVATLPGTWHYCACAGTG